MVILPTEKRFDWRYSPVMLFTIVLLNVGIFFLYQSGDSAKFEYAYEQYAKFNLLEKEWQGYQKYLEQSNETDLLEAFKEEYNDGYDTDIIYSIISDKDFYPFIQSNGNFLVFDPYDVSDNWQNWLQLRAQVNEAFNSQSYLAYGLIPSELSWFKTISYQFLHGDFMHLLGNMFFLVFCGFAVEAAIGGWMFLLLYLLSGIAGGLLYAVMDLSSDTSLVGASGSISGVMAMYLGVFRLRKIEFFYWIFVFAGYFRAPALLILPLYIGKEISDYFLNPHSNVAFMAHAGGFAGGGALLGLIYFFRPQLVNTEYVEQNQEIDPEREARAKIYEQIDRFSFTRAVESIKQYNKDYGASFELNMLAFKLSQETGLKGHALFFATLMDIKIRDERDLSQLANICENTPDLMSQLNEEQQYKLALKLCTNEHISLAEDIFEKLNTQQNSQLNLDVLARKLSIVFGKCKQSEKSQHYANIAETTIGLGGSQ
ncbi:MULTISPECIES: rhomboid family intramembrane serine protease [unclassified Oleiphilus]|nr:MULTISPECIES: rhomboid family intramembrane serine protease [unclassified Oleiphilus]KZY68433.1 hypothetical protein A3739_01280 [Oleiphilus sp. HI0067]MCH2158011.1 rhomboid family intramembrane serine protease [Oleiphilaceae bacterium]